jgi:hypothetical protein
MRLKLSILKDVLLLNIISFLYMLDVLRFMWGRELK